MWRIRSVCTVVEMLWETIWRILKNKFKNIYHVIPQFYWKDFKPTSVYLLMVEQIQCGILKMNPVFKGKVWTGWMAQQSR